MILSNKARNQTVLIREDVTCLSRNSEKNLLLCPFLLAITHDFFGCRNQRMCRANVYEANHLSTQA